MDSILTYILTLVKKAKFIIFSQAGETSARQNKVGTISSFVCTIPSIYKQDEYPQENVVAGTCYNFEIANRNVNIYSSQPQGNLRKHLCILFSPEFNSFIAVGFQETGLQPDYYETMQTILTEFQSRGGFRIKKPTLQLQMDSTDLKNQEALLYGVKIPFVQRVSFCQKQQLLCVCFADPNGQDFEFFVQKLAAIQKRSEFVYFALIVRNLIIQKTKKTDGLQEAQQLLRQLVQRAKFAGEVNVIADYPGLLDEALTQVPFCYQLFYPDGKRGYEELGCVIENLEGDIKDLVQRNEERLREEFKKTKIRYLREMKYDQLQQEEQQKLVNEVEKVNRQRIQARRKYYSILEKTELDCNLLIVDSKVLFAGMELNLIRINYERQNDQPIVLAVTDLDQLPEYIDKLKRLTDKYYIILLIKNCWQFNFRKLAMQYGLNQFNILADEFNIYEKITKVAEKPHCLVKIRQGEIQKVVSQVEEIEDTEEEIKQFQEVKQAAHLKTMYEQAASKWQQFFQNLDENNDGVLHNEEIRSIAEQQNLDQGNLLLELAVKDANGTLDQDEFIDFMQMLEMQI